MSAWRCCSRLWRWWRAISRRGERRGSIRSRQCVRSDRARVLPADVRRTTIIGSTRNLVDTPTLTRVSDVDDTSGSPLGLAAAAAFPLAPAPKHHACSTNHRSSLPTVHERQQHPGTERRASDRGRQRRPGALRRRLQGGHLDAGRTAGRWAERVSRARHAVADRRRHDARPRWRESTDLSR